MPTSTSDAPAAGMTDLERYQFDLNGFLVVRNVFSPEEIAAANAAIDARSSSIVERDGDLRLGGGKEDALGGDGVRGRADLGGMLGWPSPDRDLFRAMLTRPRLVPYYRALCGDGYRMDHLPLLIQQETGADGFVFHGGKMNDDGTWCARAADVYHLCLSLCAPLSYFSARRAMCHVTRIMAHQTTRSACHSRRCDELAYAFDGGKMYNRLLAASVALTPTNPGDGGFCVIRGSHKANLPCPPSVQRYEELREFVDNPKLDAGDVLLFSEARPIYPSSRRSPRDCVRIHTGLHTTAYAL